ncbi:hypothetical protein [Corynebacterium caspium]|uniref:hypothetical protein n=1 Tax=Corynebacterium caspium TaxID=234828 RepID=UPI000366DAB6|nr:hypothetical protein [Corynebacterium caspium]
MKYRKISTLFCGIILTYNISGCSNINGLTSKDIEVTHNTYDWIGIASDAATLPPVYFSSLSRLGSKSVTPGENRIIFLDENLKETGSFTIPELGVPMQLSVTTSDDEKMF